MARSIGCLWALGITSVSTIILCLLYSRLIFENVTSVTLDLFRLLRYFVVTVSP